MNVQQFYEEIKIKKMDILNEMIERGQEENLYLDFKEKRNVNEPYLERDDRKNFAKSLSAFSNSSGGLIIWGIEAKSKRLNNPDVATAIKPIKYAKKFLTDLNSLIHSSLVPVNNGVENFIIYTDNKEEEGVIVTYVPESDLQPHRALLGLNQYYMRAGDSFMIMEHHLLENSFGKKHKPKMEVKHSYSVKLKQDHYLISVTFTLLNKGKYLAKYPALKIKTNYRGVMDFAIHNNLLNNPNLSKMKISFNEYYFTANQNFVIHPTMSIPVATITFKVKKSEIDKFLNSQINFYLELYAQNFDPYTNIISINKNTIKNKIRNV